MVEDVGGVVAAFVARLMGIERGFGPSTALGYVEDGELVGGTVFHNWEPEAGVIELSTAATTPRWLTPTVLHAIFAYPFEHLGCQMVVLRVAERNARMRRIAERFGFDAYPIPRLRGRDEADIIYTLTDDQWRSTRFEKRLRHGQERT